MKPVSQVLESLLSGNFICPATDRDAYKTLKDDRTRREINQALMLMSRELQCTSRTSAYYVTYKTIEDHNRRQVSTLMSNVHGIIRPVVKFIATVSEAAQVETVMVGGDELNVPVLSAQIQSSPSLMNKLDSIYRLPKVSRKKVRETASEKLDVVVEFLVKEGVAHLVNKERQLYVMTGKLDFVYELLDFIDMHEKVVETVNKANEDQGEFDF
ncbi:hypothetical protein O1B84_002201 [Vibrio cholerae]|uniref:hypothetical protein n=1 Tax=Vibrio cholerae TaxID=666 RepID=UPI000C70FE45|nr:hypothetical protein [Vibrio cholerae]EGR2848364.1 hypothetical protein [Vibrio cholerae]EGR4343641.1 hypothetical protein [Vibrio cholerae]EII2378594.1 hypothetical protein [Vibrio cholerae]EJF0911575.1 hypothetical protein [Vibrio cholerae]EJL6916001.1 hypothetical protein [Vibrio cholerae]